MRLKSNLAFFGALSLFFTFTNLIPLSLSFGLLVLLLPLVLFYQKSYPRTLLSAGLLYLYFFTWTIVYSPLAFFDPSFYRRDGNFFITILPMFLFGMLCLKIDLEMLMKRFLLIVTFINIVAFLINRLVPSFAGEALFERNYYFFFFLTHNAAGGFLSILASISIAFWIKEKKKLYLFCLVTNLITLYATHSRGSFLALFAACIIYFVLKERFIKTIVWLSVLFTVLILSVGYYYWNEMGKPSQFLVESEVNQEASMALNMERSWTLIDRGVFLWPRALDLFLRSPILGTGYGSYNDGPYNLIGIDHLFMINMPEEYIYSDGHTHHSYLHILAETGIVGLIITIWMLILIRRLFLTLSSKILKDAFMLMYWTVVWSSMTEHRLFTPAQMLPFFIFLGLLIGNLRADLPWKNATILKPINDRLHFNLLKKTISVNLPLLKIRKRL